MARRVAAADAALWAVAAAALGLVVLFAGQGCSSTEQRDITPAEPEALASEAPRPEPPPVEPPPAPAAQDRTFSLVVRGRLMRADVPPADCGYFHFAAAREFEVLEVIDGSWDGPLLYAVESCPPLGPPVGLGMTVSRLELSENIGGLTIIDTLGHAEVQRFYIARQTVEVPARPGPLGVQAP